MIEEFDAIQSLNLSRILIYAAGLLLIGVILELGLRFGQRRALSKNYTWVPAILRALAWQPLFWGVLLGTIWPLWRLVEQSIGWVRGAGLISALVLISVTVIIVRLINGLLEILTAKTPSASVSLLNNLVTGVGVLIVAAIILGYLFNISFIVLLLAIAGGITGLTVVFQEPLNNLVSGVSLTVSNRLAPGDWIRLPSGIEGRVVDIQWDVTLVRQLANNITVVPNNVMTEAEIINYNRPTSELRVPVTVGVSYDSDLARVEQVTLEEAGRIMQQINGDTPTNAPHIRYNTFADFSINFDVFLRAAKYDHQFVLKHEFIKRLHQRYDDEGIVIPFPIRTLHTRSDQPVALVNQANQEATEV
jgi:small-conductance mechanosensitive channel